MIPVYLVNGFLDSGKTEFITYTLSQSYFQTKGKTLLIVCEDGENEFHEVVLRQSNSVLEWIENESEFTAAHLVALEKKHKPVRVIIEYNGMWNMKNLKLPWHWSIDQQITCIDASTFSTYFSNMKSLLAEMVRKSELIILNRCDGLTELAAYKRNLKAINQKAEIIFEDASGEISATLEEELPYDVNSSLLQLNNMQYGVWYIDMLENPERYVGKKVEYLANVMIPESFPEGYFVPGRVAMTCCADDMVFLGYACKFKDADQLQQKDWIKVTATVAKEYFKEYGSEGPVLHAICVEKAEEPAEAVISFV